jgi:hypothetical protein
VSFADSILKLSHSPPPHLLLCYLAQPTRIHPRRRLSHCPYRPRSRSQAVLQVPKIRTHSTLLSFSDSCLRQMFRPTPHVRMLSRFLQLELCKL